MEYLAVPNDPDVLAEIAQISICHGQLDYVLKMVFRDLTGLEINEALDATHRQGSVDIRRRVRALARKRFGESQALAKLDALLTRAARVTEKRNATLHPLWAMRLDEGPVVRRDDHTWETPDLDQMRAVVDEFRILTAEILNARTEGFLKKAIGEHPL